MTKLNGKTLGYANKISRHFRHLNVICHISLFSPLISDKFH